LDALELLQRRVSSPRLAGNVGKEQLEIILGAALRAPDHAQLRPWRFLTISGDAREQLGSLFAQARLSEDPELNTNDIAKVKKKPFRSPLIVVPITCFTTHPRVPDVEQLLSTGASVQNMLLAAYAQGLGAMWRSGSMAYNKIVQHGLGISENESLAGFLYLGQIEGRLKSIKPLELADYVQPWSGADLSKP